MDQISFTGAEFATKKRKTRCEKFLQEMGKLVPWKELEAVIEPNYPKAGNGRPPYPLVQHDGPLQWKMHSMKCISTFNLQKISL